MQGIDEKLVFQFLYTFSRFEYALKRAGYRGKDGNAAEAEWDRFENGLSRTVRPNVPPGSKRFLSMSAVSAITSSTAANSRKVQCTTRRATGI